MKRTLLPFLALTAFAAAPTQAQEYQPIEM